MFQFDTIRIAAITVLATGAQLSAQSRTISQRTDWRSVASLTIDWSPAGLELAGPASGPAERLWLDGEQLFVQTRSGRVFVSRSGERWIPASALPVAVPASNSNRRYVLSNALMRSDDGGTNWRNLSEFGGRSILGPNLRDLAVDSANPDSIAVASDFGVWRSADGGLTWSSANLGLPNFNVRRILRVPENGRGLMVETASAELALEWRPGERENWRAVGPVGDPASIESQRRAAWSSALQVTVTAAVLQGRFGYAGSGDGRVFSNPDVEGGNWRSAPQNFGGPIVGIVADSADPFTALVMVAADRGPRVWRTLNGGLVWDDLTADLPAGAVAHGAAFEKETGVIYLATELGLFATQGNLQARAPATSWTRLEGPWPADAAVFDAKLNSSGTQLYVAVDGYGIFTGAAPHRPIDPRLVSAADYSKRSAAPGALLSLVGARATSARAGDRTIPILPSTDQESQIQVPFDLEDSTLAIQFQAGRPLDLRLPLEATAPVIFQDRDGTPMIIDADSGVLIDGSAVIRPGMRLQILATGLGRVEPAWPTGVPAPLNDSPRVVAPVRIHFDRTPLNPSKATLAPGYVGFYLIEFEVPSVVNIGSTELYIEAGGRESNRTRLTIVP